MDDYKLFNNKALKRFEFHIDDLIPAIDYMLSKNGALYMTHTEVPSRIAGQGVGSQLVRESLEECEREGLQVVPMCPFVADYILKNPEWKRIVMAGIEIE